jgi:hypothetical protein
MDHFDKLSRQEEDYLDKVAHGEFVNIDVIPAAVAILITRGYVEAVPTLSFPVTPPRYTFRLTIAGQDLREKTRKNHY